MLEVIRKDLILNRTALMVNIFISVLTLGSLSCLDSDFPSAVYALFSGFMVAFFPVLLVVREDKFNAMALGCSLPVNRRTIVRARYVLALCMALTGLVLAFLLVELNPISALRFTALMGPGPLLIGVTGVFLILTLLLPFTLRFGMGGIMVFLITAQVLGVLLLTLTRITDSDTDKRIVKWVLESCTSLHRNLGTAALALLLIAVLSALLGLSYKASVALFQRREF